MLAGIRTPAEVVAIALEDNGIEPTLARMLSEAAAAKLAVALRSVSKPDCPCVIHSPEKGVVEWGHVGRDEGLVIKKEQKAR